MADYWKSQPRKFCQYCKCWIADNKPSIEFHERGKNHKENVAAKISEIKKKSLDKAKQEQRMSKEFAAMEEAAMKAYEEDLKRMERESAGLYSPPPTPTSTRQPQPLVITTKTQAKPQTKPQTKPQAKPQAKKHEKKAKRSFTDKPPVQIWVEGQTDDGNIYYYNTVTGESQWEKPGDFQGQSSSATQPAQTESSSVCPWMEAVSPDGYTYYYNSETGESSWEKPEGFPSSEAPGSEDNKEDESQEEESSSQAELPAGEEENSSSAPASQEAVIPEVSSQPSKVPKISFRKRKAEAEPSEKEGEDKVSEDAPRGEAEGTKKEEEVPSTTAEPVQKKEEVTPREMQAKRTKTVNPYGAWEQIQEEEDPFADVDLQLPQVEGSEAVAPAELPPEPKPKFKERIITSLGEEGGPASFRKKGQNGKSRNLRQRDNDD